LVFIAPVLAYGFALASGRSGAVFLTTFLIAHLPFVWSIAWSVFRVHRPGRTILLGWITWLLSAVIWDAMYAASCRRLGWASPDLPGEFLFGLPFGWIPAALVTGFWGLTKMLVDRALPMTVDDA
jgi:hypothetical protein